MDKGQDSPLKTSPPMDMARRRSRSYEILVTEQSVGGSGGKERVSKCSAFVPHQDLALYLRFCDAWLRTSQHSHRQGSALMPATVAPMLRFE